MQLGLSAILYSISTAIRGPGKDPGTANFPSPFAYRCAHAGNLRLIWKGLRIWDAHYGALLYAQFCELIIV
ncbi:hypothetical protein BDW68DRAFT_38714 [Aspergillus falconensis]